MKKLKVCGTCRYFEPKQGVNTGVCYGDVPAVLMSQRGVALTVEREVSHMRRYCKLYRRK